MTGKDRAPAFDSLIQPDEKAPAASELKTLFCYGTTAVTVFPPDAAFPSSVPPFCATATANPQQAEHPDSSRSHKVEGILSPPQVRRFLADFTPTSDAALHRGSDSVLLGNGSWEACAAAAAAPLEMLHRIR